MAEATYSEEEMDNVALYAAGYFGKALVKHEKGYVAAKVDGVVFVAARGPKAEVLEEALLDGAMLAPDTVLHTPPIRLEPRYHAPGPEYPDKGSVHLHVLRNVTLGRRTRKKGEALCSKKHGSHEEPPGAHRNVCNECQKVATANGLTWSLDA